MKGILGILGGGQLGQMLAEAAKPLGVKVICFDPSTEACAKTQCEVIHGEYSDFDKLEKFCSLVDVVGVEFENVPLAAAKFVQSRKPFFPSLLALETAQDRFKEKNFFSNNGIVTNQFHEVSSLEQLKNAIEKMGCPSILKTRSLGYDGKGQYRILEPGMALAGWESLGGKPCLLEAFVPFDFESSCIAVRSVSGDIVFYEPTLNVHENGILVSSLVPANISESIVGEMKSASRIVGEKLGVVGTYAVEFFISHTGSVVAGEIAPRVHNTGHWTQDGAVTSQFENHIRAVMGLSLGSTERLYATKMYNILGSHLDKMAIAKIDEARLHDYAKTAVKGRKLGHVNLIGKSGDVCVSQVAESELMKLLTVSLKRPAQS